MLPSFSVPDLVDTFAVIGAAVVGAFLFKVVANFFSFFLRGGTNPRSYGEWAIVTGATDGIGLAIARKIAGRGVNVVLVSRTMSRLKDAAKAIEKDFSGVQTRVVALDFSSSDEGRFDELLEETEDLDVGMLVNNVGVSYPTATYLTETSDELVHQLVQVNCASTMELTRLVLRRLVERKGKKGLVLNISSAAGSLPDPLYAGYSASKAFVEYFTTSLDSELVAQTRGRVRAQCNIPLFVVSKLSKFRRSSFFIPTPEKYAAASMSFLGRDCVHVPYWPHAIQLWAAQNLEELGLWGGYKRSLGLSVRKRALKKAAEKAAKKE